MNLAFEHLAGQQRFQARIDGETCVAESRLQGDVMAIVHTDVAPHLNRRGIAGALVQAALDHAQAQGLKLNPACSYAAAGMRRHPGTMALLGGGVQR